ncbi:MULTISPECIES: DNA polymerase III subunit alpha [Vagococcus]|uniref:DNA polymerase III subunit alpha n=1 Tax=Vagococcus fluvialis bH819 TaxID=1255619 RepID=A0A1X6WRG6_9ENTE|nr:MULTISPECIES: DNA polymerase III subunit alpha [Vagococcus]SLM86849.1 DNA polymerase III alpha subunit [Vagococcus fluvialis bH819]HCM88695.1 DNA polymerase III subunit alpha [Vagococcus sp.]
MELGQLQVLTSYSLLKSTNKIDHLVSKSKELGYSYLAITDIDTMHGVVEFYNTCHKKNIMPLIGMTLTYKSEHTQEALNKLILIAKNQEGYQNLIKISSLRMENDTPIHLEDIKTLTEHLIAILPSGMNELRYLYEKELDLFLKNTRELKGLFKNSIYQGIVLQDFQQEWLDICQEYDIPLVALQDIRYLTPSDHFSVEVLEHIDSGEQINIDFEQISGPYYLPEKKVFEENFQSKKLEEALVNNLNICKSCQFEMLLQQKLLPAFPLNKDETSESVLKELCFKGLFERQLQNDHNYIDRLTMELSVIHEMGYDDYFLIVWDVMKYARDNNIVTACRGSAAGSLVSYVLRITNVDPIEYGLLFERFLNKERYTMPDIDMDIPDNKREEILQYVSNKYGYHRVAQIATFGTLAAKMALRDVSRVFGMRPNEANTWSNTIPNVLKITLDEAFEKSHKLRDLVAHSEKNKLLFETARKIEGLPRHVSTHAAGVVISDQDLTNLIPLQQGTNNIPLTQMAMGEVEEIGLLKMDFLGLRNLSIIGNTLDSINYLYKETIDLETIPLDDQATLDIFKKGETVGIFQFESDGIKKVLRKLGPSSIEDIASVNALYRPGPMQNIDLFIDRKKGKKEIIYPHDNLKNILDYTYGVIVYQEQIMQVASLMAGFSLGQADILRRAVSKKKKDVLDVERAHFIKGSKEQGYTEEVASEVYDYIERFANYGFNRSHAVVYSVLAYQMAYLKVHYPECFFSALLHSVKNNPVKINEYSTDAKKYNVTILPPDINKSDYSFTLNKGKILFGFSSLKGIRKDFIQHIITIRKTDGPYTSLENLLIRMNGKWLKEANILPLIYIGAFDSLHSNRKQLITDLDSTIRNIEYTGGSIDLLEVLSLKKENVTDFTLEEKLNQEAEYLGSYISGHPIDAYNYLRKGRHINTILESNIGDTGQYLLYVTNIKKIRTKKGESMAFLSANDGSKDIDITIFPQLFRQLNQTISENNVYLINGKIEASKYNQMPQLLAENIKLANEIIPFDESRKCYIKIMKEFDTTSYLNKIKQLLKINKGDLPVILVFDNKKILLDDVFWVTENEAFTNAVFKILGDNTVIFQ